MSPKECRRPAAVELPITLASRDSAREMSSRRRNQNDIVLREGSGSVVGPLYATRMIQFIADEIRGWRPGRAVRVSGGFVRCVVRLRQFAAKFR